MPSGAYWRTGANAVIALFALVVFIVPTQSRAQALTGWTDSEQAKRIARFADLTPDAIASTVTTEDDDLEVFANLTTERAFKFKGGFTDRVRSDNFLRAHINKKSGAATYQLYEHINYSGDWREFEILHVETANGPTPLAVTTIGHDATCVGNICDGFEEDLVADVPEQLLRWLADRSAQRPVTPWRFRFKAHTGLDWTDDMAPAEAAGILLAVDAYRSSHHLK